MATSRWPIGFIAGSNIAITEVESDHDVQITIAATVSAGPPGPAGSDAFTEVVKANDETVTNSTAMQDDDELFFATTAGKLYAIELYVLYSAPTTTPDLHMVFGEDGTIRGMLTGYE